MVLAVLSLALVTLAVGCKDTANAVPESAPPVVMRTEPGGGFGFVSPEVGSRLSVGDIPLWAEGSGATVSAIDVIGDGLRLDQAVVLPTSPSNPAVFSNERLDVAAGGSATAMKDAVGYRLGCCGADKGVDLYLSFVVEAVSAEATGLRISYETGAGELGEAVVPISVHACADSTDCPGEAAVQVVKR